MAHRRRSNGRGEKVIDQTRWSGATSSFLAQGAGNAALNFVSAANSTDTVLRMRGELLSYADGVQAPGGLVECALGIIKMPEGQGTTVVSSPIADTNAPWMFFETWVLGYEEMVTDVIALSGVSVFRKTIDLKAMRILRPDIEMQIVFEQATIGSAMNTNTTLSIRTLLGQK